MEDIDINYDNIKKTVIEKALFFVLIIVFLIQFAFFTNAISQTVEIWPIVYSKDNDAANGIKLSQKSNWISSNNFFVYGNLYFRISNTLSKINPLDKSYTDNYTFSEDSDKVHHFSLMIVSLLSIYGMSFLLSFLITKDINKILVSIILINTIFMSNKYWVSKVFGVHPDLLLCFFSCLGIFFSIKSLSFLDQNNIEIKKMKNNFLILSAISWGLALSVKPSALFFIPALFVLFLPLKKTEIQEKIIDYIKFSVFILITYFTVGFPQNFDLISSYNFMYYQAGFSTTPTLASFNEWWFLLYEQYIIFLPILFFLVLVFSDKRNYIDSKSNVVKLFIITFIPFWFLLTRNVTSPHEHYTLPIAIVLILFTAQILINFRSYILDKKLIKLNSNIFVLMTLVISLLIMKYMPNAISKEYETNMLCKDEAKNLYNIIKSFQTNRLKIHVDPYVPFNQELGSIRNNWFKTFEDITPNKADILVFSKKYYSRYTTVKDASSYIKQDTNDFDKVKDFYDFFDNKNQVKDKYGQKWQKIFSDNCGWEIWQKK